MQVIDIVDRLFVEMFDYLNENCKKQLEAIDNQYPFEPLKVKDIIFIYKSYQVVSIRNPVFS